MLIEKKDTKNGTTSLTRSDAGWTVYTESCDGEFVACETYRTHEAARAAYADVT